MDADLGFSKGLKSKLIDSILLKNLKNNNEM